MRCTHRQGSPTAGCRARNSSWSPVVSPRVDPVTAVQYDTVRSTWSSGTSRNTDTQCTGCALMAHRLRVDHLAEVAGAQHLQHRGTGRPLYDRPRNRAVRRAHVHAATTSE